MHSLAVFRVENTTSFEEIHTEIRLFLYCVIVIDNYYTIRE